MDRLTNQNVAFNCVEEVPAKDIFLEFHAEYATNVSKSVKPALDPISNKPVDKPADVEAVDKNEKLGAEPVLTAGAGAELTEKPVNAPLTAGLIVLAVAEAVVLVAVVAAAVAIVVVVVAVEAVGAQETVLGLKEGIPTEAELAADAADVPELNERNGAAPVPDGAKEKDVPGCLAAGKVREVVDAEEANGVGRVKGEVVDAEEANGVDKLKGDVVDAEEAIGVGKLKGGVVDAEAANGAEATAEPVPKLIEDWEATEEVPGVNEKVEAGVEAVVAAFKKEDNPEAAPNGDEAGEVVAALELEEVEERKLGNDGGEVALGAENELPLKSPPPVVEAVRLEVAALEDDPKREEPEADEEKLAPNGVVVEPVDCTPNSEEAVTGDAAAPKREVGDEVVPGAPKNGAGDAVVAGVTKSDEGDAVEVAAGVPKSEEEDAAADVAGTPKKVEEAGEAEEEGAKGENEVVEDEEAGKEKEKGEEEDEGAVDPNVEGVVPKEKGEEEEPAAAEEEPNEKPDMGTGGGGIRAFHNHRGKIAATPETDK
ncbi:hypothetical protein MLD38_023802 [Melastoma candidum]|uniref:Uncharacterized protein n=1 Tax=Melastoma candidum TaxID=119954 RepID=A0ACB9NQG5_9MYRT|nr:hypothetical protein MLD38_023802 [Melastoma candidum]